MIRGSVTVRLPLVPDDGLLDQSSADRRALDALLDCPPGVRVLIEIGARRYFGHEVADLLHQADGRLDLEIRGENPHAVAALLAAARAGGWSPAGVIP